MKNRYVVPLLAGVILLRSAGCLGESRPIRIDGRFDDWSGSIPAYTDPAGDGSSSGIDIRRVWLANNDKFLFMRFELGEEISLQTKNSLVLHLDTDNSPKTGLPVNGIGSDLSWYFGQRRGFLYKPGGKVLFNAYDADLVTAPTMTSDQFEIEIRKDAVVRSGSSIFPSNTVRWILRDEGKPSGDIAPDKGASATYTFGKAPLPPYTKIGIKKGRSDHLRVMTYNVFRNGLFARKEPFSRILKAVRPDVMNFQEMHAYSAKATKSLISQMLGGTWYAVKNKDCITVTRYPITSSRPVNGGVGALINLPDKNYRDDLFIINAHFQSGSRNIRRQSEADSIISFIRDAKKSGGPVTLTPETPILIVGDLNLVGVAQQLKTLLAGDIVYEGTYGPDHRPDWDSSPMIDLLVYHKAEPKTYTWAHTKRRGFGPGRLDYIIYTDSVISAAKSFVLRTESMSASDLSANGLLKNDSTTASDHLPVVADFVMKAPPG